MFQGDLFRFRGLLMLLAAIVCHVASVGAEAAPPSPARRFIVAVPDSIAPSRRSSRVFVFLSSRASGEPRLGPNWFQPDPFFGRDVAEVRPGDRIELNDSADGFPAPISQLPNGTFRAQAVLDQSLDYHNPGTAPDNFYSDIVAVEVEPDRELTVELRLDHKVEEPQFAETNFVHEIKLESELLSRFHGWPVIQRAAVVLPRTYHDQPERRYPVIYSIPGFGGDYREALALKNGGPPPGEGETEFIRVFLSGECRWGHHVFANSATNGPRGDAFIHEIVPAIDERFRTVSDSGARYVTGHSSGGWAALWLLINYPKHLGGAWSTSPDPVDFRDFQQINLYEEPSANMFVDAAGNRRPIARRGTEPILWYDSFSKMDDVLSRGGQLRSFEAVFSPRDAEGAPARLWNRQSGTIDPAIARAWQAYDIRAVLERDWNRLAPHLSGKLHIWTGSLDTFYLEGAVRLLKTSLDRLGSDAEIHIVEGRNHATILTPDIIRTIRREMSDAFARHSPQTTRVGE